MRAPIALVASLAMIATALAACGPSTNIIEISSLSSEQMLEDYDYLIGFLEDNYVFFDVFEKKTGIDWLEHAAEERKSIMPTTTSQQFFQLTQDVVAILDNHHARILPANTWERFHKSITSSPSSINSNRYQPFFDDTVNQKYDQWKRVIGVDSTRQTSTIRPGVSTKVIEDSRIAYIGISSFSATRVASEKNEIAAFFEKTMDYPYLIIDITKNPGGSDRYWMDNLVRPLITTETISHRYVLYRDSAFTRGWLNRSKLSNITDLPSQLNSGEYDFARHFSFFSDDPTILQPDDTKGFEGQIIIMTSGRTASSANNFATFAKHSGWATLAGEPTHGAGAADAYTSLPNSGLVLQIDNALVLNNDGSVNFEVGTQPDVIIDGEDKLEQVIEYINRVSQRN